ERRTADFTQDPVGLPAAENLIQHSACRPELTVPERQIIRPVETQVLRTVKTRQAPRFLRICREWEKQEVQFFVFAEVDGLGPRISHRDKAIALEFPRECGLQ